VYRNVLAVSVIIPIQDEGVGAMGYQQTLMYGRYSQALGEQLKQETQRFESLQYITVARRIY
jgi:hypothetical protein